MSSLKRIALIPARGGSKGIKKKNLSQIGGISLLEWAITFARDSNQFDEIYIDTDDAEIQKIGSKFGCSVPRLRPSELATDSSSIIDSVKDFLSYISNKLDSKKTCVVLLQPTTPFRSQTDLQEMIDIWLTHKGAKSIVSVTKPLQSPKDFITKTSEGRWVSSLELSFHLTNRQQIPVHKFITGGMYIFSRSFLETHNALIVTDQSEYYDCKSISGIDIDDPHDLQIARAIFAFGLSNF